jgi:tetratricopeptide (TPR) repeat protein
MQIKVGKMNSVEMKPPQKALRHQGRVRWALGALVAVLVLAFAMPSMAAIGQVQKLSPKEAVLREAKNLIDHNHRNKANIRQAISLLEGYKSQYPNDIRFPLYLAEAYYRLADPTADVSREFPYYEKSEFYAEKVLAMDPNRPEGHYWHGLFLLKKAQKRGISGYFIVKEGIRELEKVRQEKPGYDHAGASRVLGLLYCLAPGWTPFGNLDKSIELEKEATHLAPDYALNRLYLANAYKKKGDNQAAIREYRAILTASATRTEMQGVDCSDQARAMLNSLVKPM